VPYGAGKNIFRQKNNAKIAIYTLPEINRIFIFILPPLTESRLKNARAAHPEKTVERIPAPIIL
jgi:hypothetical protein